MNLPVEVEQAANQIPEVPRDPFLSVIDHINSNQFDGIVRSTALFTNANAEQLGLALLRKQNEIRELTICIHGLSSAHPSPYPALLRYFETSAPSGNVSFLGLFRTIIDPTTGEQSIQPPVTTHEVLNTLLTMMVEQYRSLPSIRLSCISLSETTLACLQTFPNINFFDCDINGDSYDRSSVRMGLSREFNADQDKTISFHKNTPATLMNASQSIVSNTRCRNFFLNFVFGQSQMERLNAAIELVKKCRKHHASRCLYVSFTNLDTGGSLAAKTMCNLASQALVLPMCISFEWSQHYNLQALQIQAQSVVEAASQCRFMLVKFLIDSDGSRTSIFNAQQQREIDEITDINCLIPRLIDDTPEEFWMANLWMVQCLLHPKLLAHQRFGDVYYRFLRKNLLIFQWIVDHYRPPAAPAALLLNQDKDNAMSLERDGPSGQTRCRARSDSGSSSAGSKSNQAKKRKS